RPAAPEEVVASGGQGHDIRGLRCPVEVGEHALRRVPVAREVDEVQAEPVGELRRRAATGHAGEVIDGGAVPEGEIGRHGDDDAPTGRNMQDAREAGIRPAPHPFWGLTAPRAAIMRVSWRTTIAWGTDPFDWTKRSMSPTA